MMGSSGTHLCVHWGDHQKNLLEVMSELLRTHALTDVTLGVEDGQSVQCHKMILAACSVYFQKLFTKYPEKHPFVMLSGVKYQYIMTIVEFMYKGEVNVAKHEMGDILKIAVALQIRGLIEALKWKPDTNVPPSPANNTSNDTTHPTEPTKNAKRRRKSSSPAHSTSSPYHVHEESSAGRENQAVPSPPTWNLSQGLPLGPQDLATADAAFQSSLSSRYPPVLETDYEKTPETPAPRNRKRKMSRENVINRRTSILQTALKQGHAVTPLQVVQPIYSEHQDMHHSSPANGSMHSVNEERDDGQSSVDLSYRCPDHSPRTNNGSMNGAENTSFSEEAKAGIAGYNSTQGHEGKRYKKYSRDDLTDAIQAVKEGMSANKAAVLFKVPSRTLYDKIKKLGFTNQKHRRSGSSSSSACFPYGIGGNVDGRIYGHMMENDNDNSNVSTETPLHFLETSYGENRDTSTDRETITKETDRNSPSPPNCPRAQSQSPLPLKCQRQESTPADHENENDNEAQDLSVSRKSEIPFSIPPNIVIKEEKVQEDESMHYATAECSV